MHGLLSSPKICCLTSRRFRIFFALSFFSFENQQEKLARSTKRRMTNISRIDVCDANCWKLKTNHVFRIVHVHPLHAFQRSLINFWTMRDKICYATMRKMDNVPMFFASFFKNFNLWSIIIDCNLVFDFNKAFQDQRLPIN